MGKYSYFREKTIVNYVRPRYKASEGEGSDLKALINVTDNRGALCWGIVDADDNFIAANQQLKFNPWTGKKFPQTLRELKSWIG